MFDASKPAADWSAAIWMTDPDGRSTIEIPINLRPCAKSRLSSTIGERVAQRMPMGGSYPTVLASVESRELHDGRTEDYIAIALELDGRWWESVHTPALLEALQTAVSEAVTHEHWAAGAKFLDGVIAQIRSIEVAR